MGTWGIGGGFWSPDYSRDRESIEALRYGIENGITVIDTAEMYGGGHAEELVGQAIKGFNREDLFIITKVWNTNASYERVLSSAKASSKRLGTYIDLYLLHWPSSSVSICETIRAFEHLVDTGTVRFYGVSNFSLEMMEEALSCQRKHELAAVENQLSLGRKDDLHGVVKYAEKRGMLYLAYTPIDKGAVRKSRILDEIGRKYGKTPIQVALNWLIMIPPVVPIPKSANKEHIRENLGAFGWRMEYEDWKLLERAEIL